MAENNRILIVDDDPGVREAYRDILSSSQDNDISSKGAALFDEPTATENPVTRKQFELTMAIDGEEGIAAVENAIQENNPFSAAFIDMQMPGIDGAETSKRIWAADSKIKIVIVTAYSEFTPEDIIRVTGRNDIFYLRKPFNPEEIRQFATAFANQWNLEREREQLAAELEDMNQNLQQKVEEQAALLVQSEKMASVGILAAGVAHEVNNPIAFINGNLSTLKKYASKVTELLNKYQTLETCIDKGETARLPALMGEIGSFKKREKVDFILEDIVDLVEESLDGTKRVGDIVRDLKTFSRVDEAEVKLIDINEAIEATLNIIWNEIKYKAEVVKDYGDLPQIKCFAQKISQVFMNILLNAAQAIEENGTITIKTHYIKNGRRTEDAYAQIRISDSGTGIAPQELSRIFDPFFTTKPVGQGTGLGLSITYDIIKAHGGKILVDSEKDKGTTFTINLPMEPRI